MSERWEASGDVIAPSLLSRYSSKLKGKVSYSKWLEWCEDDRTTGSALSTNTPCSLYFLVSDNDEILGGIIINHRNTHRGHLHAGVAPWHRGKGYGSLMLRLALDKCREMGMDRVDIVPHKENVGAIKTIMNNGGILQEEFLEDGALSLRYSIDL